jgi:hypothetical protein
MPTGRRSPRIANPWERRRPAFRDTRIAWRSDQRLFWRPGLRGFITDDGSQDGFEQRFEANETGLIGDGPAR